MKKLLTFMLALVLALTPLSLAACQKTSDNVVRLSEVAHSIFYAPMYIAVNKGYFRDEGIEVEISNAGGADKVMTAITSKSADIGLMGTEAVIYCHVQGQENYPILFGQLTHCDGSFLVGRSPDNDFNWSKLEGKHVIAGRPGGMPAMILQYVIETKGNTSIDKMNFDTSVAFNMMVGAFEGDKKYDYVTMFEPTASEYEKAGKGYIVASVGKDSGDVPYTAFCCSKSYLKNKRKNVEKFLRAIKRGYEFMISASDSEVAAAIAPSFEGTSEQMIISSVKRYAEIGAWSSDLSLHRESFEHMQDIMTHSGNLSSRADFDKAVDNTIANSLR